MLSIGPVQIRWIKIEFCEAVGGKLNIPAVYISSIEKFPFCLCRIYKVCVAWPCWKLEWDRIRRFGKCLKNQTRPGINQAAPKLSFHIGFVARGGFPGHGMLVTGIQIFPAHFAKGGGKALGGLRWFFDWFWRGFFFVSCSSIPEVKWSPFYPEPALELEYLFSPSSSSSEGNRGRTQHRGQNATSKSALQHLLAFPRVRMVWDSSRIRPEGRWEVPVVSLDPHADKY